MRQDPEGSLKSITGEKSKDRDSGQTVASSLSPSSATIAALATAPGASALSVVRLSGEEAFAIADGIVRCRGRRPSQRRAGEFFHARLRTSSEEIVDDVIVLVFKAPHSYTGEDVVEIQGHGGAVASKRLLGVVMDAGARLAEPGEFTRRAFLNGKLDLVQSEAVMDLIQARGEKTAQAARNQLEGSLSSLLAGLYDRLASVCARVEVSLDFDETDEFAIEEEGRASSLRELDRLEKELNKLRSMRHEGHVLREGALVVISGQPNVGKSTLMNSLLGNDRAIVSDIPGTTRDSIEEGLVLNGWPLRLVDTAGVRQSECRIEREGVRRSHALIERADINIHVITASRSLDEQTDEVLSGLSPRKTLIAINKCDQGRAFPDPAPLPFRCVDLSLNPCPPSRPFGINALKDALLEWLDLDATAPAYGLVNARHEWAMNQAAKHLAEGKSHMRSPDGMGLVLAAQSLRSAAEDLASILGRRWSEDLLDRIFSGFCIGK